MTMKRRNVLRHARAFLRDWSIPRQLRGLRSEGKAAESHTSRRLRPRLELADRVGTSICPYCAVGCAQKIYAREGRPLHVEGDPASPINRGTLCPKGAATFGLMTAPDRLTTCRYRAPFSDRWEDVSLDWAMERIAQRVKQTRDETFVEKLPDGETVNHTLGIASLGGATLDNEENYLIKKVFGGGLGIVGIENQARICHANSVPSLGTSFGRGAATMPQWDLANADCILVMGSNMAEAHPIAFRFALQAQAKGAKLIHVDPRFTRTSAMADLHAPIRAGTDIAFLGGIIRYIIANDLVFRDYAVPYTNIANIIDEGFVSASDNDGRFSGWNPDTHTYNPETWQYDGFVLPSALAEHYLDSQEEIDAEPERLHKAPPPRDPTLQHPNCVYQILKRHYAPYTPEMVERITGCPQQIFLDVAAAITGNSGRERTTAICYAVGWNHHSVGVQMIRAASIVQSLLGNIGRPGGGILALRGHTSIQGSTDIPTLFDMLPSYMPQPHAFRPQQSLEEYLDAEQVPTGWWHNFPKYMISLLKAWYGANATAQNGYCYRYVPKIVGDHSQLPLTLAMEQGLVRGLFLLGQNVVMGGSNSALIQRGLGKLDWLVVRDSSPVEAASFWERGEAVRDGSLTPADIGTEVFLMPASLAGEKAGTFTNTHRLVQWHEQVVDAPGESRSELWFVYHLGRRLKELYSESGEAKDEPIRALNLDYPTEGPRQEPSAEAVLREINGYRVADGGQLKDPAELRDDGSTACGSWLYVGCFPEENFNKTAERNADREGEGHHLGWAFAWPANRRVLYNRASADPEGRPWSARKALVAWNAGSGRWEGPDEVDFEVEKAPDYRPDWEQRPEGMDAISGDNPFVLLPDGVAHIFVPSGLKDGPLPSHYEPVEAPVANPLYRQQRSPVAKVWERPSNPIHAVADAAYPYVLTTYRLTEHHTGGAPTRSVASTAALQPQGFIEISPELAGQLGLSTLDRARLSTARGAIEALVLVTGRMQPLVIDGRTIHQVGMPWHFGWEGLATGDIANVLTAVVGDGNTGMHENKALTCNLMPAPGRQP